VPRLFLVIVTLPLALTALVGSATSRAEESGVGQFSADQLEFFEKRVRPLLVAHCYECHSAGAKKLQAGLRLDFRDAMIAGGDSGAVIVPGDAEQSLLIQSVRYESYEMPPAGKLSDEQIGWLVEWVKQGAAWPDEPPPESAGSTGSFDQQARKQSHWVWQSLRAGGVAPAASVDHVWAPTPAAVCPPGMMAEPHDPIDRFIAERLSQAGLKPAPPVDRRGLIRRLHFDLVGLPPAPEVVERFVADTSPDAIERVVDSLLQSPHFGERWGRHWLDLVRYAESRGHEFDHDSVNSHQYRDYVIRGFNADVPYDRWVAEHIAGDLLPDPRINPTTGGNESILGTGFWFLGEWVHSPVDTRKDESDRFDNMIDVMSKTFLGLTVACARCHDHKFDAITTADYYALSGFLQSSDFAQIRFDTLPADRRAAEKLAEIDSRYRQELAGVLSVNLPDVTAPRASLAEWLSGTPPLADPSYQERSGRHPLPDEGSVMLVDYAALRTDDFLQNGFLFGAAAVRAGQLLLSLPAANPAEAKVRLATEPAAMTDPFWNGIRSISQGGAEHRGRLGGLAMAGRTLRSPTVRIDNGSIVCRVRGRGHVIACVDSHRLVLGPLHNETVQAIPASETWQWVRLNLSRYVGSELHFEFVPDADASLEVAVVAQGPSDAWLATFEQRAAEIAAEVSAVQQRIEDFLQGESQEADRARTLIREWAAARRSLRGEVPDVSRVAMGMLDGSGVDDRILIRGNASTPGKTVPRRFLSALDGEAPLDVADGSGRLELVARINDPRNPLAHRVIVNRIWHHLMGRGLVPTVDDFGVLGQPPTHPELLDHLAQQFLADGRSIKRLIRRIVLSRTYQMSSQADPAAVAADPKNELWHHRDPKRLDGESIRDGLLSVSGRLDTTMEGEPIPIHLTTFMDGRGRPGQSGPLDGAGRRSLYVAVRRNFISPFMLAFDTPVPFSTMGRRNVSNVPAQALILMNDPFVIEQAGLWAKRTLNEVPPGGPPASPAEWTSARIDRMYRVAFARGPSEAELATALAFLESDSDPAADEQTRWTDFAHALINTKEFIFLR
jgi:hypothetical protein